MQDIPWAAVVTAVSTLGGIWMTNRAASRRTQRERLWDLKREAYGEILVALGEYTVFVDQLSRSQIPDEKLGELSKTLPEQVRNLRNSLAKHGVILSDEFQALHHALQVAIATDLKDRTFQQACAENVLVARDYSKRMREAARHELGSTKRPTLFKNPFKA